MLPEAPPPSLEISIGASLGKDMAPDLIRVSLHIGDLDFWLSLAEAISLIG